MMPHSSHDWSSTSYSCIACGCLFHDKLTAPLPCRPSTDDSPEAIAELREVDWLKINAGASAS